MKHFAKGWFRIAVWSFGLAITQVSATTFTENFDSGNYNAWTTFGSWQVTNGVMESPSNSSNAIAGPSFCDFTYSGDVEVNDFEQKVGLLFRVTDLTGTGGAFKGYYADVRFSTDRTRLELWRMDAGPWVLLQSTMIYGVSRGSMLHLKVTAVGPDIWAYAGTDSTRPAITEYDTTYSCGQIGIKNDGGATQFDNLVATDTYGTLPQAPLIKDWSWVQGAVFYPSYAMNSVNFWTEYDSTVVDRELSYAQLYGLNTVCIYFNWLAWDNNRSLFLQRVEDFLTRADHYGLKVYPVFFDNAGNTAAQLQQLPPIPGVHNSRLMECPAWSILSVSYPANTNAIQDTLKAYVQDIVNAHVNDPRILFWEVFNEPYRDNTDPVNGPTIDAALVRDGYNWIKQTGTQLPVVSTAGDFLGGKYSDFYTYHMYVYDANNVTPECSGAWGADGGSEHLNTEGMDRPWLDMQCYVDYFRAHQTGFTFWELMIARTQIRYPWSCNAATPCVDGSGVPIEPSAPFHGLVFADGHPWSLDDVKTLLNTTDLSKLPVFDVTYYTGNFGAQKLTGKGQTETSSITPRIDFDLPNEYGQGNPDAIARVSANDRDNYSIRWTGQVLPPCNGSYTFSINSDNIARLWIDTTEVINKTDNALRTVTGSITLTGGELSDLKVEYVHDTGASSIHVYWQGPCFAQQVLPGRRVGTPALAVKGSARRPTLTNGLVAGLGGFELALPSGMEINGQSISVFDLTGHFVTAAKVNGKTAELNAPLPKGLYLIRER